MGLTTGQDLSGANQNLQAANFGRPDMVNVTPDTQPTFAPAPPSANGDVQAPVMTSPGLPKLLLSGSPQQTTDIQNLQKAKLPFFSAIAQGGANISNPNLTKGGKLLTLMMSGLKGALDGSGGRTFGEGYQRAEMLPIEKEHAQLGNEQLQQQVNYLPLTLRSGLMKTNSEINKNQANANLDEVKANGQQYEDTLHQAQTEASKYKEVGGVLYDLSSGTPKPIQGAGQFIPATPEMAQLAGIPEGSKIPIETATKLTTMVNAGVHSVQANGRAMLVDSKGNTIRDLGAATPLVVANMGFNGTPGGGGTMPNGVYGSLPKEVQSIVDAVGSNRMNLQTAIQPYRRYPKMASQIQAALTEQYPAYAQQNYQAIQDVVNKATSGAWADQKVAFNTAMQHAELLDKAARALNNGDTRAFNSLKNDLKTAFGDSSLTDFNAISHAYTNEVQKMLSAGHLTDSELSQSSATMPSNANYATIHQVLDSYKKLAQSKLGVINDQIKQGMKGTSGLSDTTKQPTAPTPAPATHVFSKSAWLKANPNGDVNAAVKAATAQNFTVTD